MSFDKINVGGVSDPHYRYTRPALKVKEELRGTNGQRTVIENIEEVAKAVHFPPNYPTQFFGYELSVSARFQEKTKEGGRTCTVLAGIHSSAVLERIMTKFELLYVVCPVCKDGGTRLSVSKKNGVRIKCGACGKISPPRASHKLEKFMVKNPPPKQQSGLAIGSDPRAKSEIGAIGSVGGLESVLHSREEASPKKESKSKSKNKKKEKEKESKDKPSQEVEAKEVEAKENPQEVEKQASPLEKLQDFVKILRGADIKAAFNDVHVVEICSELDRLTLVHSLSKADRLRLCLGALVDIGAPPKTLPAQFQALRPVLLRLAPDRNGKLMLIAAIVQHLVSPLGEGPDDAKKSSSGQSLLSYLPMILMALYETNTLGEGDILAWIASPPEVDNWAVGRDVAVKARKLSKELAEWLASEDAEDAEE